MNLIDERFELCSLISRLMPFEQPTGHNERDTAFQRKLDKTFAQYKTHAAVEYAADFGIGFDAVGHFALRLEKYDGLYRLIPDLPFPASDDRWVAGRAEAFVHLVNDFNRSAKFEAFFAAHEDFYAAEAKEFYDREYGKIDFAWLEKYMQGTTLHVIFSPSLSNCNYGSNVGTRHYAIVPQNCSLIHEFCHGFGNPLADEWYKTDARFKQLCDDSVDAEKQPWYNAGYIMAREYVTRAFHVLYDMQHGETDLDARLSVEQNHNIENTFPFMREVYNLVLARIAN